MIVQFLDVAIVLILWHVGYPDQPLVAVIHKNVGSHHVQNLLTHGALEVRTLRIYPIHILEVFSYFLFLEVLYYCVSEVFGMRKGIFLLSCELASAVYY